MSVERQRDCRFVCAVLLYWTDGFKSSQLWKLLRERTSEHQKKDCPVGEHLLECSGDAQSFELVKFNEKVAGLNK